MQKCKKSSACAVLGGFGGACFALTYLLCADLLALRCVVWWRVEIAKISVRRGFRSFDFWGLAKILQNLCKNR